MLFLSDLVGTLQTSFRIAGIKLANAGNAILELRDKVGTFLALRATVLWLTRPTGTNRVGFTIGSEPAADVTYNFPVAVGAAGQVLSDPAGDGSLEWVDQQGGYIILTGTLAGEETLLDTVAWFNGKWDLIVRNGSLFYMSTVTAVSDGAGEPAWIEDAIVYGGAGVIVRCEVSGATMRVLAGGTGQFQIKRHIFLPMGPPPPPVREVTAVSPDPMTQGTDPVVVLTGSGFTEWETSPGTAIWLRDGVLENGPVAFTIDSDTQITIASGSVPGFEAMAGPLLACYFELRSVNYAYFSSPTFPILPPPNPMADAIFTAFDGGPGQIAIDVALGIAGYQLAALENPPGYIQSVYAPDDAPTNQWTSAVFFRRRDADGGLITFANVQAPAWNLDYYNGALDTVSATLTGNFPVEMLPMWLPPDDYNWHMAVFVHDWLAGSKTLYLDGALAVQDVLGTPSPLTECYAYAGTMPPVGAACQGAPIIWRRALDGAEIASIWTAASFPP